MLNEAVIIKKIRSKKVTSTMGVISISELSRFFFFSNFIDSASGSFSREAADVAARDVVGSTKLEELAVEVATVAS